MAKINFMDRENLLREFELKEDLITIGREATNQLVIADPSVSRQHATIEKRQDGYYLTDKNSSNGTYINGKRITQQKLTHKDKVNLGSASIVFEDEEQVAATFILPRDEMPEVGKPVLHIVDSDERPTDALTAADAEPLEEPPLPPPPPMGPAPESRTVPPSKPAVSQPQSPPKIETVPEAPGILCPSCRKVVEAGARFCGFCGSPLGPAKPVAAVAAEPPAARPAVPKPAPSPQPSGPLAAAPKIAPQPMPQPAAKVAPVPSSVVAGNLNYAGFGVRLVAYLIDVIITTLISLVLNVPTLLMFLPTFLRNEDPSPVAFLVLTACQLLSFVAIFGYMIYFIGAKGATPGKKMMKLRVTLPDGNYPIGYGKAFLRTIGYMVSGLICYIGFLMIAFDKEQHRGLHDKIAGTVVIRQI